MVGKYLYCVIEKPKDFSLSIGGLDGRQIYLINAGSLSAVVSDYQKEEAGITRENLLIHDEVVSKVLKIEKSVLPAGFGTIIKDEKELKDKLLSANRKKLENILSGVRGKGEMGVKAGFKDLTEVIKKLLRENKAIQNLWNSIRGENISFSGRVEAGKIIQAEVERQKKDIKNTLTQDLKGAYLDYKEIDVYGEKEIFDLVFLIELDREKEFLQSLEKIENKLISLGAGLRITGPAPAYHFVRVPF